ncbi:MAG: glycosyltransferase [Pirellula sp.]|jgi:glycosyltransferase involved in cell wall biosynthesis
MARPRLLILIIGHFANAPRAQKEAFAAQKAGFDVFVRGAWTDPRLAAEDLEIAVSNNIDFAPLVDWSQSSTRVNILRGFGWVANQLCKRLDFVTPRAIGRAAPLMLKTALSMRPELTMVHSESGLWVAKKLLSKGFRVGVDFEDWFSRDNFALESGKSVQSWIAFHENWLVNNATITFATTEAMCRSLAIDAHSSRVPTAVPNSFPVETITSNSRRIIEKKVPQAVSFYWFSQTIGPGRGLERIASVLPRLHGRWELHIRGNLWHYESWFEKLFQGDWRRNVYIHSPVRNSELPFHTMCHDVGLALETSTVPNKDVTASNKIFEYLRCGLAVIATDTQGQREVLSKASNAGMLIENESDSVLQNAMQSLINDPSILTRMKLSSSLAGRDVWNWSYYEKIVMESLLQAVCNPVL